MPGKPSSKPPRLQQTQGMARESAQAAQMAVQAINQGNVQAAEQILQQALARDPKHPDLLHLFGYLRVGSGQLQEGIALIEEAIKLAPKVALFHYNLGNALFAQQDKKRALGCFQKAVRFDPKFKDAIDNLAIVSAEMKKLREAETLFERSVALAPKDPKAHLNLAKVRVELGKPDLVESAIKKAAELGQAGNADFWFEVGLIYKAIGLLDRAEGAFARALELAPQAAQVHLELGRVLGERDNYTDAEAELKAALEIDSQRIDARVDLANVYITSGQVDKGRAELDALMQPAWQDKDILLRAAQAFSLVGDFNIQEKLLLRVLELEPENMAAQSALAFVPKRKLANEDVSRMEKRINDIELDRNTRCRIGFALGNHYRNIKDYNKAFEYYRKGNTLKGYRWDRAQYRQWVNQTCEIYTKEFFAARAGWGSDARMPILIVGMPRSGTTLLEQILSAHSQVHGAGEFGTVAGLSAGNGVKALAVTEDAGSVLKADAAQVRQMADNYLSRLRGQARHGERFVTNKLPHNFQQVGLFALLFPHAPVIHVQRDPRDNLLSVFLQNFTGYHPYAYDLKNLAFQYWEQERLMRHWKAVCPNPILSLKYEELVADLPGRIKKLADFLGIEVEASMARFHEQEREVNTASKWQVRQKLYATSVERWKPYEKQLRPLFSALEEYAL